VSATLPPSLPPSLPRLPTFCSTGSRFLRSSAMISSRLSSSFTRSMMVSEI